MAIIGKDIRKAKSLLTDGGLVAIPTETVYGLAGNAFNEESVVRIFEVKNRPSFDPLIVHTHSLKKVKGIVKEFPEKATLLAAHFWPGPLTLLLPKKRVISDLVTSGMDTVAIRIPNQPLVLSLLESLEFPLVAPSANPFGYVSPTSAAHVNDQLGDKIPYILDGGNCPVGIESTIAGFENGEIVIHRLGGTSKEEIERVAGPVKIMAHSTSNPKAPGMLKSHYAPGKDVILGNIDELIEQHKNDRFGVISFNRMIKGLEKQRQIVLAADSNPATAARHLFSALRAMDNPDVDVILAEFVPDHGLGRAVNDRLRRASAGED